MTFFSLIRPYYKKLFLVFVYILAANLLALALPFAIKVIVDTVIINKEVDLLNSIIAGLLVVLVLRSVLNFWRKHTSSVIGEEIICGLRQKIYEHIHRLSLQRLSKITPAQIMTRMTGDLESMRRFFFNEAVDCVYGVFSAVFLGVALFIINVKLAFITLLTMPLFVFIYIKLLPDLRENHRAFKNIWSNLTSRINEVLNGAMTVRALTTADYEIERLKEEQQKLMKVTSSAHALTAKAWICMELFSSLGILAVLWVGGLDVINNRMTIGGLIAFYSYLGMLFAPLARIVAISSSYQETSAALERINEILTINDELPCSDPTVLHSLQGMVEFKDVNFGYATKEEALKGINFKVRPGETIGIVGASGAGKTTLMNLLLRFYDPRQGEILIDGVFLKNIDLNFYRKHVAAVFQDDHLFSGTIEENIRYGSFDATPLAMVHAARLACADEFIDFLPEGYLTRIGERGLQLSSGQRQRLVLARALLRRPSMLILDEATSAIDALTENQIQQSIREFMKGKTVFIIAHRFSTIMEADRIIVFDKGKVVEIGEHNYLLNKGGLYSNLYFEQFREKEQAVGS